MCLRKRGYVFEKEGLRKRGVFEKEGVCVRKRGGMCLRKRGVFEKEGCV